MRRAALTCRRYGGVAWKEGEAGRAPAPAAGVDRSRYGSDEPAAASPVGVRLQRLQQRQAALREAFLQRKRDAALHGDEPALNLASARADSGAVEMDEASRAYDSIKSMARVHPPHACANTLFPGTGRSGGSGLWRSYPSGGCAGGASTCGRIP